MTKPTKPNVPLDQAADAEVEAARIITEHIDRAREAAHLHGTGFRQMIGTAPDGAVENELDGGRPARTRRIWGLRVSMPSRMTPSAAPSFRRYHRSPRELDELMAEAERLRIEARALLTEMERLRARIDGLQNLPVGRPFRHFQASVKHNGARSLVELTPAERSLLQRLAEVGGRYTFRPDGEDTLALRVFDEGIVTTSLTLDVKHLVRVVMRESELWSRLGEPVRFASIVVQLTAAGWEEAR